MRITQWGEFGILCSVYLARRALTDQQMVGAVEISIDHSVSLDYAQQILHRLKKGGIVESVRGPHGGYRLSRSADDISLLEIIKAVEGDSFEVICDTKPIDPISRCATGNECSLRNFWYELRTHVDTFLSDRPLSSLVEVPIATSDNPNIQPIQIGSTLGNR